jgi:hypothetical protein
MGITATAVAKRNKLKRNAEWRATRRTTSDAFKKAEQESRDRYNEFTKLSREFSKTYPNEFKNFLMAKSRGVVARQTFGLPRNVSATTPAITPATMAAPIQLPDFRSVSSSGSVPSAQKLEANRLTVIPTNENGRPKPPASILDILGIARD